MHGMNKHMNEHEQGKDTGHNEASREPKAAGPRLEHTQNPLYPYKRYKQDAKFLNRCTAWESAAVHRASDIMGSITFPRVNNPYPRALFTGEKNHN